MKLKFNKISEGIEDLISEARNLCKDSEERILRVDRVEKTHLVEKYLNLLKKVDDDFNHFVELKLNEFNEFEKRILDLNKEKVLLNKKIKKLSHNSLNFRNKDLIRKINEIQEKIKVISKERELLIKKVNILAKTCIRNFKNFKSEVEEIEELFFEECEKRVLQRNFKNWEKIKNKLSLIK